MSKKKRAAKLAKAEARKALIDGRVEAAWADFEAQFEDPYDSQQEFESEREMCLNFYQAGEPDGDGPPAFFREDETDMGFAPWVFKFRDEMVAKHRSEAVVDPLVRFQVARLFQKSAEWMAVSATSLKVITAFIKHLPVFASQVSDDPMGLRHVEPMRALSLMRNPYGEEDPSSDVELVTQAWRTQYGAQALSEAFCPPMFLTDDEGTLGAPWVGEFRDLMVLKYGSLKAAEPRIRFIMAGMIPGMVERLGGGVWQTRTIEEEEQLEALVDRVDREMHGR